MHILVIPSEIFLTNFSPLGGIFQLHQAQVLKKFGFNVGILSNGSLPLRPLFKQYIYDREEIYEGINIIRFYKKNIIPYRFQSMEYKIKFNVEIGINQFEKYIKKYGIPDCIHAHNIKFAGFVAESIKKKFNIPFVLTEHSSEYARGLISKDWVCHLSRVAKNSYANTAVSTSFSIFLENFFSENKIKFSVLPNVVDPFFVDNFYEKKKDKKEFVFLNIASMDENKDQETLIKSFASKFKGNSYVKLKIAGTGILNNYLYNLVRMLEIESQVEFLGFIDRKQVFIEMNRAQCFVLSSQYETFGVVLIEALALGTPVISTRSGGPEDIVNEKCGLVVPVKNIDYLANAMHFMIINHHKYNYIELRNDILERFGSKIFFDSVKSIYEKATNYVIF